MFLHLYIFRLNSDKANNSFLHSFLLLEETDFRKMVAVVMSNLCLRRVWWWKVREEFLLGKGTAWVKILRFNSFSRNKNAINFKLFPTHDRIHRFERKFNKHSEERQSLKEFIETRKEVLLRLILKSKGSVCTALSLHFVDSNNLRVEVEIFSKNGGTTEERCVEIEDSLITLVCFLLFYLW